MEKEIALVYMVAGMSSRFLGKMKFFAVVGDKGETLIEYSIHQALPAGFTKIIFIVGKHTEKSFREKFGNNYKGIPIEYCLQDYDTEKRDKPWGSGDAVCAIKDIIDCPFVVCSGDDLYGKASLKFLFEHLKNDDGEEATVGIRLKEMVPEEGTVNRGIFEVDENNYVTDIKETINIIKSDLTSGKLSPESFCSMSIFALHPETLNLLCAGLEKFKMENAEDRKKEYFLSDELAKLIKSNKIKMKLYPTPDKWMGITNPGDEDIVKRKLAE